AHLRASMPTDRAVQTPVEQSLQALQAVGAEREQAHAQRQQQEVDARARDTPAMRMA
ncbi:hemolysin, partial [Stenotrophomonas maltophilia]|nr:hemolysin [Stenotrophomonas maltophilia]MCU1177578.1 hemolysin [Stenotrophomonas maltophilia]